MYAQIVGNEDANKKRYEKQLGLKSSGTLLIVFILPRSSLVSEKSRYTEIYEHTLIGFETNLVCQDYKCV